MKKLIDESELQILVKVAQRASLLQKAAEEEAKEKMNSFFDFVKGQLLENNISEEVLQDERSRNVIVASMIKKFDYEPSEEVTAKIQKFRDEAYTIIPQNIGSERWQSTDCPCIVERVYDLENPENAQTFKAEKCEHHKDLDIEELHDTRDNETQLRLQTHTEILSKINEKKGEILGGSEEVTIEFEWSGEGKNRVLKPIVSGDILTKQEKEQIKNKVDKDKITF